MAEELFQEPDHKLTGITRKIYLLQFRFKFIYILQVKYYY